MSQTTLCPVCGTKVQADIPCSHCGFLLAGVTHFADQAAYTAWQKQILTMKDSFRTVSLRRFFGKPLLAMNQTSVAALDPERHELHLIRRFGRPTVMQNVKQASLSASHGAAVMTDGTVTAWGESLHQECSVAGVSGVSSVLAADSCTYLVMEDGSVQMRGASPYAQVVAQWSGIRKLASGRHHLLGLRTDGTVCIASEPGAPAAFRSKTVSSGAVTSCDAPKSWKNLTDVVSADDYALALTKTGRVLTMGKLPAAIKWPAGIVQIAAARDYAMALTKDSRLLCTGTPFGPLSTDLEAATGDWSGLLSICGYGSCAAAMTMDRQLLVAGMEMLTDASRHALTQVWRTEAS